MSSAGRKGPTSGKPLRRDAAHNRERLLDAASVVFAEHGLAAGVDEVARTAGVGMGTLYRRFPTKQALIDELVGELRRELLKLARTASTRADGVGLEALLVGAGELQAMRPACLQRLWEHSDSELDAMHEFRAILAELLASAQNYGRVRADVTTTDISMVLWSVAGILERTRTIAPNGWRRHLELLLAGLRPPDDHDLAADLEQAPLTEAQARRVTASRVPRE